MCDVCRQNPCSPRCPNADEPKAYHYCSYCGEGIYEGEKYIKNDDDKYIHYECPSIKELIEFLGYKVEEMKHD